MGRDAKRAKQARRDQRKRHNMPPVTVHEVRTEADLTDALAKMLPTPKTGDWRPDVLGQDTLSMQPGMDGWPLINGHRVTREMCQALQAERPHQAKEFVYEAIVEMAEVLGPPDLGELAGLLGSASGDGCSGIQLDHRDGSMSCSRGDDCTGLALPHQGGWTDCEKHGPCAFCDGPPVTWVCDHH